MMNAPFHPEALRLLIQSTLKPVTLWTPDVEELLMATIANESDFGVYRTQAPNGPARGIVQMEAEDFTDIWNNYLVYHQNLSNWVKSLNNGNHGSVDDLVNNDPLAIAYARIHYLRRPGSIPPANDIEAIFAYYKAQYNSAGGAASHDTFMAKYDRYVRGQS